jgi:UTP--glucose-1-phosphate uridylyltransferase
MTEDSRIIQNPKRKFGTIQIDLDDMYYKKINQLKERFSHGTPSLIDCKSLRIKGNVYFDRGIVVKGDVNIINPLSRKVSVPEGMVINKDLIFN